MSCLVCDAPEYSSSFVVALIDGDGSPKTSGRDVCKACMPFWKVALPLAIGDDRLRTAYQGHCFLCEGVNQRRHWLALPTENWAFVEICKQCREHVVEEVVTTARAARRAGA
jgi:hypothetical protein